MWSTSAYSPSNFICTFQHMSHIETLVESNFRKFYRYCCFYCAAFLQVIQKEAPSRERTVRWGDVKRGLCIVQHWCLLLAKRHFTKRAERQERRQSRNALVWPRTGGIGRGIYCKLIELSMSTAGLRAGTGGAGRSVQEADQSGCDL